VDREARRRTWSLCDNRYFEMRVEHIELKRFKRFHDLTIEVPKGTRLVMLAGPNGCGKSSLFEAFLTRYRMMGGWGGAWDATYFPKAGEPDAEQYNWDSSVKLRFDKPESSDQQLRRKMFYMRSAYRNDPEFIVNNLGRHGSALDERRFNLMIQNDACVNLNYQRLASQALEDLFDNEHDQTTIGELKLKLIGDIRSSMGRLFPDLMLNDLGNPLVTGTFRFDKGTSRHFEYKNLSGGEKAAFDLLLDFIVKRREFDDTVYCIDEPETHMNTRLQAALLGELASNLPPDCQMWLATHSIGMMRSARDIEAKQPGTVAFLDFSDLDFDKPQVMSPVRPTRAFWERVLNVALDDVSALVTPDRIVICEGTPSSSLGKNSAHDARCYDIIFESEFPDTRFLSGGNASDVQSDRLALVTTIKAISSGCEIKRLVDRDDHSLKDVQDLQSKGMSILSRRHIECFLYDDEVLTALCEGVGRLSDAPGLLQDKADAVSASVARGNPPDDIKSAAGQIYISAKKRLCLTGVGNDQQAFARSVLAPLLTSNTQTYKELRHCIFGI
jgi:predicted ATPase